MNTNLPPILHRFQVMANQLLVKFSLLIDGWFILMPPLGMIPMQISD